MKTFKQFLIFIFMAPFSIGWAHSADVQFISSRDMMQNDSSSNINLHNKGTATKTVYGLYVREFAYVAPGQSCAHATKIYPDSSLGIPANITAGSFVMPITINSGKSVAIGKNYLYNMIFQSNYYVFNNITSSPPGCAIPGCTWGSDSTIYNWCIKMGALGPAFTTTGYTATVPPSVIAASSAGVYDYNLISQYVTLGPISCNDQTLTCVVLNQQTQSFP